MATYIDTLRDKQWPELPPAAAPPAPPAPPRTDEEKNETRDRAHHLISARCRRHLPPALIGNIIVDDASKTYLYVLSIDSNYLILKKTDVETVFNLFQNSEENKTLVYVSISTFVYCI